MTTRIKTDGYTYTHEEGSTDLEFTKYIEQEENVVTPIIEYDEPVTLTIVPTPSDASVFFEVDDYIEKTNQSITVYKNSYVKYTVVRQGYNDYVNTITVRETTSVPVTLTTKTYTLTITTYPADATLYMTAPGYTQQDNHIVVPYGTQVAYEARKLAYNTSRGIITVNGSLHINVVLTKAGNAAKFMNYGTCVVCFQTQDTKVFDLEYVYLPYEEHYDYGTNLTTGYYDEFIDCGGLDA